jgi:hypothetical protein
MFAAALCALGGGAPAAQANAYDVSDEDALLVEIRMGKLKLSEDVRGYSTEAGACLDFGDVIQSFDLPVRLDKKSRRATGWLFQEDRTITVDGAANTVQIMNKTRALRDGELLSTPEGWCVDTGTLSDWFGVTLRNDLFNSVVHLEGGEDLPFLAALERKSRAARLRGDKPAFDLAKLDQVEMDYRAWRAPSVDIVANVRHASAGTGGAGNFSARYEMLVAGEALGASYQARLASNADAVPESLRVKAFRINPNGGLLGPLKATQVVAGDVETLPGMLTGQSAVGRGAFLSNRPLTQPSRFATTQLRGTLPSGWDAELYRNGQLIAFQREDGNGRYAFLDIDLLFGQNELEVVLYGPQGQIRRESTIIPVGVNAIEPGKTWWWAGMAEQGRDLIEFDSAFRDPNTGWRWGVGVEHGIDKRTSVALGAQSVVLNAERQNYIEASANRTLGPVLLGITAAQRLEGGSALRGDVIGRVGTIAFQAQSTFVNGDYRSEWIDTGIASEHGARFDTALKLGSLRVPVSGSYRHEVRRAGGSVSEWAARTALLMRNIALTGEIGQRRGSAASYDDHTFARLLGNTRIGSVNLRGEAEFRLSGRDTGFEQAAIVGDMRIGPRSDLRAEIRHERRSDRTTFEAGYVHLFKHFDVRIDGNISSDGSFGGGLSLALSLGPDPLSGGVRVSREKLARNGQAAISVFLDEDGDGERDPGEKGLPDVQVAAGLSGTSPPTDRQGNTILDGLAPYRPVVLQVDEGSLEDPFLRPSQGGVVLTPRPGVAATLELGVAPTGEVEGVLHGLGDAPRGGVGLELVDRQGRIVVTTVSEYDGFFLFERVPYGAYSLRVTEASARALAAARAIPVSVKIARDADIARLGIVNLSPTTIAATTP